MVQADAYRVFAIPAWHEKLLHQEISPYRAKPSLPRTIWEPWLLWPPDKPLPVNRALTGLVHKEEANEIKRKRRGKSPPVNP